MVELGEEFYIADQGDGWWHCPSPIRCTVIDGPGAVAPSGALVSGVHLLAATELLIEWNGDSQYSDRLGPDDPLCHPIGPTNRLLLGAAGRSWEINLDRDYSVPAFPVTNGADRVRDAEAIPGLGMKVAVWRHQIG